MITIGLLSVSFRTVSLVAETGSYLCLLYISLLKYLMKEHIEENLI